MIWPFTVSKPQQIAMADTKAMITGSVDGEVVFDWPAIRAYLERPSADTFEPSRQIVQVAYAGYLEGIEKGKATAAESLDAIAALAQEIYWAPFTARAVEAAASNILDKITELKA